MRHHNNMNDKIRRQKEHYSLFAKGFDKKYNRENSNHLYKIEEIEGLFFSHLISKSSKKKYDFLEIGGGTGVHARHFLQKFEDKIGKFVLIDLSREMVEIAKPRLTKYSHLVDYYIAPAEKIDIDQMFDGIYISGALHHFASPFEALKRAKKLLRPGGVFVVCEPVVWNPVNFIKAINSNEFGQFTSARRGCIRSHLKTLDFTILSDRVLHYRSGSPFLRKMWPYKNLESFRILDPLAIMFLFGAMVPEKIG